MSDTRGIIKCIIWDLDNTLWKGTLLEDENVLLREGIDEIIKNLDGRGILQSIASKNDYDTAMQKLAEFGLEEYFIYPEIHWNSKVQSVKKIATAINIGLNSIAFIDDQPVELDEVNYCLPEVTCIHASEIARVLDMPIMNPRFMNEDLKNRRHLYLTDIKRKQAEEEFVGSKEEFLASLDMVLTIFPAEEKDLQRVEELTVRTNQLNSTGYSYSYEALKHFLKSDDHQLLMVQLHDKYGDYGRIGLALLECNDCLWTIKLLLMSCRVMSRGVGTVLLNHIMRSAKNNGVRLQAEFVPNDRNRMMNITYHFAGFTKIGEQDNVEIMQHNLDPIPAFPDYIDVRVH